MSAWPTTGWKLNLVYLFKKCFMSFFITELKTGFEVAFKFDHLKVAAVKEIAGSYYLPTTKSWMIPKRKREDLQKLIVKFAVKGEENFSSMPPDIQLPNAELMALPQMVNEVPPLPELETEIPLARELFHYQKKGVAYNLQHKKVIIGDQMGLGKTANSIATIVAANAFPCLIICPATLKLNWQKEWMTVAGRRCMIMNDRVKSSWQTYFNVGMVDVFIVNFESLPKFFVKEINTPDKQALKLKHIVFRDSIKIFGSVIIDEIHKAKAGETRQAKLCMGIAAGKEYILGLTGTPLVNKPIDLISQLHIIDRLKDVVSHLPVAYGKKDDSGYTRFIQRYCGGPNKASNLKELNYRLNLTCFYRREKSEVMKDLPPKIRQVVLCEIDTRKEYIKAETEFVEYLKSVKGCSDAQIRKKLRGEVMVKMGILKNISARGKMEAVKEHIDEVVDGGEKIVVFCHLKEIAYKLKAAYPEAVSIIGDDSMEARQNAVEKFQNDPATKVIICSIKAAGVGITLTASSKVVFVEFPWTFADCEQAEDRCHRIGATGENIQCSYFLGEDTIDNYCYDLIQKKKGIAQTVTGASDDVQEELINELLTAFKK